MTTAPWRVLWIGGSSGTGKSMVAQALARRLGLSVLMADDVRLALQALTGAPQQPTLHAFLTESSPVYDSPEAFRDGLIAIANLVLPALKVVADHHKLVRDAGAVIIEGDGILPRLAAAAVGNTVSSAIFLHEAEQAVLLANMRARQRAFQTFSLRRQAVIAGGSWLYGNYLADQARACGLPVLASRPFETLLDRVLGAVDRGMPKEPW